MIAKRRNGIKTLKISKQLHEFLDRKGRRGESFEDIIWRLATSKKLIKRKMENLK